MLLYRIGWIKINIKIISCYNIVYAYMCMWANVCMYVNEAPINYNCNPTPTLGDHIFGRFYLV